MPPAGRLAATDGRAAGRSGDSVPLAGPFVRAGMPQMISSRTKLENFRLPKVMLHTGADFGNAARHKSKHTASAR